MTEPGGPDKHCAIKNPEEMEPLRSELGERFGLDGWAVVCRRFDAGYVFEFSHELSSGVTLGVGLKTPEEARAILDRFISRESEFAAIGSRPSQVEHPAILVGLRAGAANFGWSKGVLTQVADVLSSLRVITAAEFTWLEQVGPRL